MREAHSVDELVDAIITAKETACYHRTSSPQSLAFDRVPSAFFSRARVDREARERAQKLGELANFALQLYGQGRCDLFQRRVDVAALDRPGKIVTQIQYLAVPRAA